MKTAFQAARLALAAYILPYMFVYSPGLLWIGAWHEILISTAAALIGVVALAAAVEGWLLGRAATWQRIVLAAGALLLVAPAIWSHAAGLVLVGLTIGVQLQTRQRTRGAAIGTKSPIIEAGDQ